MFEYDEKSKQWTFMHHPFTSPQGDWHNLEHHEIKALENNTVILNLYRNPMSQTDDLLGQWL